MIMNRKKPGHQGLYIGKIHRYNPQTEEIHILLKENLIHIPEKGDGILIETNPNLENDNNQNNAENSSKDNKKSKTKQDKRAKRKEIKCVENDQIKTIDQIHEEIWKEIKKYI